MKEKLKLENLTNYLIPAICFIAVIVMIPLVIIPQLTKITESSAIIKKNTTRLKQIQTKASALVALESKKSEIEANLNLVETVLPITKDVAALVSGIQELARSSGLLVNSFKIQPGKTATESASPKSVIGASQTTPNSVAPQISTSENLVFNMSLSGDVTALKSFLHSIETGKRLLTLSTLKSSTSDNSKFSIELFLNAPFSNLPKLSSDQIGAPLASLTAANLKLIEDLKSPAFVGITDRPVQVGPTCLVDPFTSTPCKP